MTIEVPEGSLAALRKGPGEFAGEMRLAAAVKWYEMGKNASPIITLAKVGQLGLIEKLASPAIVPEAVAAELLAGPQGDPARVALEGNWGRRLSPQQIPPRVLEWGLGAGESSVLALCLELGSAVAVLDDAAARAAARALNIPVLGTLGVVVRAKQAGLLASAAAVIADLRKAGLYVDDGVVAGILARIGE
jgi:predicted nucleic acid-binding protein